MEEGRGGRTRDGCRARGGTRVRRRPWRSEVAPAAVLFLKVGGLGPGTGGQAAGRHRWRRPGEGGGRRPANDARVGEGERTARFGAEEKILLFLFLE
jgi:hypothetical protein